MKGTIRFMATAVTAAVLLAGCAGARYTDMAPKVAAIAPDSGRIYFYQPVAPGNVVSSQPYLRVNGQKVGRSKPGHFFYVNRPAGQITVSTMKDKPAAITFMLAPGQTRYVRLSIEGAGSPIAVGEQVMREEPSEAVALNELATLRYWGAGSRERAAVAK